MESFDPNVIFNPSAFFIKTPALEKLKEQLHHWLRTGMTGGLILGDNRIGKTRAIEYVSHKLVTISGEKIPAKRITISLRDVSTITSIFRNLCFALDIPVKTRSKADDMANDLTHYLGELSLQNSNRQVVLLVDEMQRLKVNQLNAFAELHDNLVGLKSNLCIFFIGNLGSSHSLLETIMNERYELIRGRFFTHTLNFYGLQGKEDVSFCLKEFDKDFTEHYLPKDYNEGWRLDKLSIVLWHIFEANYKRPLKLDSWALQYFIAAVRILLVDYLPRFNIHDQDDVEKMIIESIKASGLTPDLISVQ